MVSKNERKKPMPVRSYRELIVWQKAMDLVEAVYQIVGIFPKDEVYDLQAN